MTPRRALVCAFLGALTFSELLSATAEQTPLLRHKVGVLLVNHGSRSKTWREALLQLEKEVAPTILKNHSVSAVKTAFMEYNEPSIATRMKEFDADQFTDVIIIPVFLTVSSHSFDDIPTILKLKEDAKSLELLKLENIERYQPRARIRISPMLDFGDILQKNILRRAGQLSKNPAEEGLVLVAYGDHTYEREWAALLKKSADYVARHLGVSGYAHAWCGHVAAYDPGKTTTAIESVLAQKKRVLVIPVLVAHDEMFQVEIIGGGVEKVPSFKERVVYRPDAILPDDNIRNWVTATTATLVSAIKSSGG